MRRLILFLIMMTLFSVGYTQSAVGLLTFDTGYYQGVCLNNTNNKYITYLYLQFLTNGGDTTLVIFPYNMKNSSNTKTLVKNIISMNDTVNKYLMELSEAVDDIENHEIVNRSWSINGFDNFTYFEVEDDKLSFSINIANIETNEIEVFYFDGVIQNGGNQINAVVYSEYETFPRGLVLLELSPKIINNERKEIQ